MKLNTSLKFDAVFIKKSFYVLLLFLMILLIPNAKFTNYNEYSSYPSWLSNKTLTYDFMGCPVDSFFGNHFPEKQCSQTSFNTGTLDTTSQFYGKLSFSFNKGHIFLEGDDLFKSGDEHYGYIYKRPFLNLLGKNLDQMVKDHPLMDFTGLEHFFSVDHFTTRLYDNGNDFIIRLYLKAAEGLKEQNLKPIHKNMYEFSFKRNNEDIELTLKNRQNASLVDELIKDNSPLLPKNFVSNYKLSNVLSDKLSLDVIHSGLSSVIFTDWEDTDLVSLNRGGISLKLSNIQNTQE